MRKRPTGRKVDRPVPSRAVIGARTCSSQSWALEPNTTPAAPRPTMPRKTRRPTGVPLAAEVSGAFASAIPQTYGAQGLMDGQLPAIDAFGGQLGGNAVGHVREGDCGLAVGLGGDDRPALVAALPQRSDQRDLADERHLELVGQLLAAAAAEDLVALGV